MINVRASLAISLGLITWSANFAATPPSLADLQAKAAQQKILLAVPTFPHTTAELEQSTDAVLSAADAQLKAIAALPAADLTFANTVGAFDALRGAVEWQGNMLQLQREANVDAKMRETAGNLEDKVENWGIALDYREDVYQVLKRFAETKPKLAADEQRLLDKFLRDYRRAGLALSADQRHEVEQLRKTLTEVTSEFTRNINEARGPLDFTAEQLAGVPPSLLESPGIKQPDGTYRVMANVTWQAIAIGENATNAETRKKFYVARNSLAMDTNTKVLAKMVSLRAEIARKLGYATWGDYQVETRMAKTAATAIAFEEKLVASLQPKFTAELATLQKMKAAETGQADAVIESWDTNYYINQLKKQKYSIDVEALRVFFPYEATLNGMFRIYERIFGLTFTEEPPPDGWAPGLKLFAVTDTATGRAMGLFYLDMFPREGKYNHFACFPITLGRYLPDGRYEVPVVTLLCNFPPPSADKPSLLAHADVVTLFHEFGHVMHAILSRSHFTQQSSFNVPQDFVEAPSQMLENWVWDKAVLDTFAADYRDPTKKIPAATIAALTEARRATEGLIERRQLAYGLLDLALHAPANGQAPSDPIATTNAVLARVTLPVPEGTGMAAYFGHLEGYSAAYYGYLWSKVIAQDMASVFRAAPDRFLDKTVGRRLRDEVYGVGDTRDVSLSVEKFLGRPTSNKAFLEDIGIP
jgi:thimet oligopeptidase